MAAALASGNAPTLLYDPQPSNQRWVNAYKDIIAQFASGFKVATVDLNKVGEWGDGAYQGWLEAIQGKINAVVVATADPLTSTITVMPVATLQPDGALTFGGSGEVGGAVGLSTASNVISSQSTSAGNGKGGCKEKVPRPPNSFIIYRQEWHPVIVKAHPGMHNNEISKLIARKWKEETEAVRDEYKRKAEDAKRQHAIDHPGYQYQPRKPSEKKKRMTKNKLAKLRAQADAAAASDPMKDLNEMLAMAANDEQVTIDTFQAPYRQGFPNLQPSQEVNNHLTFDANDDHDMLLYNSLVGWNADNPRPSGGQLAAVFVGQPLADGQETIDVPQHEVPYSFTEVNDIYDTAAPATCFHDATAEVERQDRISEAAIGELFNFEAYAAPAAESALQDFQDSYVLDFEQSGSFHI